MAVSQLLLSYGFLIIFNATFFTFVMTLPYVARDLEMPDLNLAYSQTFFNVLQLCSTTLMGSFLHKLGFRLTLALPFLSLGVASFVMLKATSPTMILMAQFFGLFMAGQQAVQLAVAQMTKPGSERTKAFSKLGLCFGIGFMFTPIISKVALIAGNDYVRAPLVASSAICLGIVPIILMLITDIEGVEPEKTENEESSKSKLSGLELLRHDENLRLLFVLKALLLCPSFILFGSMGIYLMNKFQVSQTTNTLLQLDVGVSVMFSNSVGIGFLRKRYTEHQLIWIGSFVCAICYAQFCYFEYLFQIWPMLFFLIFATTIAGTSADSLISSSATHEQQGIVLGLSNSVISVARTSAPTFGMWIYKTFGYGALGLIGVVTSAIGILYLYSSKSFAHQTLKSQEKKEKKTE
ncbi:MFS domain-containing protein [Aphelenchoides bicaudatus]|nr:MFS domain-containing protein [Aphelenchoides bicaudatus]